MSKRATTPSFKRRRTVAKRLLLGVNLMELMVGITIGMLVVVAAMNVMSFTQITSTTVADGTQLQQNADAVFRNLGFQATQAGAVRLDQAADAGKVVFSVAFTGYNSSVTGATTGQILAAHGIDGGSTGSDTLRLSYEDDGGIRDCQGNTSVTSTRVDNEFTLSSGSLMCKGASASAIAQPIADGVEDFQVWYGVITGTGAATTIRFLTASNITDWTNIQALRVCLVMRGERQGNPQPGLAQTGCRGQNITADGFIRRIFWRTYALRNKTL